MSSFKGTYFRRNVALVEQSLDKTKLSHNLAVSATYNGIVTFTDDPGTTPAASFHSATVKSVRLVGYNYDKTNQEFVISDPAKSYKATYEILAELTFRTGTGSAAVDNVVSHTFKCEVPYGGTAGSETAVKVSVKEFLGSLYVPVAGVIPASNNSEAYTDTADHSIVAKFTALTVATNNLLIKISNETMPVLTLAGASFSDATVASNVGSVNITALQLSATLTDEITFSTTPGTPAPSTLNEITSIDLSSGSLVFTGSVTEEPSDIGSTVGTFTASSLTLNATIKGKDGTTSTPLDFSASKVVITPSANVTFQIASASNGSYLVQFPSAKTVEGADDTTNNINKPKLVFTKDSQLLLENKEGVWTVSLVNGHAKVNSTTSAGILLLGNKKFQGNLIFKDVNKNDLVDINPAWGLYQNLGIPYENELIDFSTDAGFNIPYVNGSEIKTRYVRISDLVSSIENLENGGAGVPDLADRLHALEVTLRFDNENLLEEQSSAVAVKLASIKNRYSALIPQ